MEDAQDIVLENGEVTEKIELSLADDSSRHIGDGVRAPRRFKKPDQEGLLLT
jgi:hypothetical protein